MNISTLMLLHTKKYFTNYTGCFKKFFFNTMIKTQNNLNLLQSTNEIFPLWKNFFFKYVKTNLQIKFKI